MNLIDLHVPEVNLRKSLWLGLAISVMVTAVIFVTGYEQIFTKLQNNQFSLPGDTIIVIIAFVILTGIGWGACIFGEGAGWLYCTMFEIAPVVMLQIHRSYRLPFDVIKDLCRLIITQVTLNQALRLDIKSLANAQWLDILVAKTSSQSKTPYQLYSVSCILLS